MNKFLLFLSFSLLLIFNNACKQDALSSVKLKSSTQLMIDTLKYISKNVDPDKNYYANHLRAEYFLEKLQTATPRERGVLYYSYLKELINSGDNKQAIKQISDFISAQQLDVNNLNKNSRLFYELLALAYLRDGELENCVAHHSSSSCIFPLDEHGIHQLKNGSTEAIKIYESILKAFPDDYSSRWLINVAHMTLGSYPDGVPKQWLIPGLKPEGRSTIIPFKNIAGNLNIDVNGLSGGVCIEDFNNDGFLDIMASSYGLKDQLRYFESDGNGSYIDKTQESGLTGIVSGLNMIHADYNNDGNVDVFLLRGAWLNVAGRHPNSLLKNNGDGTFEDVSFDSGLLSFNPTQSGVWADFNNDGWLDLFIANETEPLTKGQIPVELYLNNKDGSFTNVAQKVGILAEGFFKGVCAGDINNDGWPDIYLSNLNGANVLLLNNASKNPSEWKFSDITKSAGVMEPMRGFPAWMWDYNNDGLLDIFASCYDHAKMQKVAQDEACYMLGIDEDLIYPRLFENNGNNSFSDVTFETGLQRPMYPMGSNFGDIDNDGFLDFYLGTGTPDLKSVVPNLMFHNKGGERFEEITYSSGTAHVQKGHGVGFGDMDNDGDQDFYVVMGGAYSGDMFFNALFENYNETNNWITLKLEGVKSNRSAIGARIKITAMDSTENLSYIYATVGTGGSFGASSLQQEIGLGKAQKIKEIEIVWPNRKLTTQIFRDVKINAAYKITEGDSDLKNMNLKSFKFKENTDSHHQHHH